MWETIFLPVKYLEYSSVSKSNSLLELCYAVMQLDSGSDLLNVCPQRFAVFSWKCLLCLLLTQRPVSSGHVYWLRVPFTFILIYIDMSNWGNKCYIYLFHSHMALVSAVRDHHKSCYLQKGRGDMICSINDMGGNCFENRACHRSRNETRKDTECDL